MIGPGLIWLFAQICCLTQLAAVAVVMALHMHAPTRHQLGAVLAGRVVTRQRFSLSFSSGIDAHARARARAREAREAL